MSRYIWRIRHASSARLIGQKPSSEEESKFTQSRAGALIAQHEIGCSRLEGFFLVDMLSLTLFYLLFAGYVKVVNCLIEFLQSKRLLSSKNWLLSLSTKT